VLGFPTLMIVIAKWQNSCAVAAGDGDIVPIPRPSPRAKIADAGIAVALTHFAARLHIGLVHA
jgi:hypothetical protein